MRLIRVLAALALLKAGYWMIDRAADLRPGAPGYAKTRCHPAGHVLLASLAGLAVCFFWIWINGRAWQ